jgi:hypothetical protein
MKRFTQQLKKKADSVILSVSEKNELRERVVSYMEYHPLPAEMKTSTKKSLAGESFSGRVLNFNGWKALQFSGLAAIVLMFGVSYIAEKAVPGDTLYAVKVSINEEVRGTLARSSYEKVVWETERLNRRIAEARLLADEGRLTEEVEEQVASAVKVHSDNARKEIAALKEIDSEEAALVSIELETALDVQSTSLRNRAPSEVVGKSTALIASALTKSQEVTQNGEQAEVPSYTRLIARVEIETTRAQELLSNVRQSATVEEQSDIKRRLSDIDSKVALAMSEAESDDLGSRNRLVEALQQTHRLIVFMTNIDVQNNVSVNDIVPVTLTQEERLVVLNQKVIQTKDILAQIGENITASSTGELAAKARPAIATSAALVAEIESSLMAEGFAIDVVESKLNEAFNLAKDVAVLLEINLVERIKPVDTVEIKPEISIATSTSSTTSTTSTTSVSNDVPENAGV